MSKAKAEAHLTDSNTASNKDSCYLGRDLDFDATVIERSGKRMGQAEQMRRAYLDAMQEWGRENRDFQESGCTVERST